MSSDQHHHLFHFYNYIYRTDFPSQWNAGQTVPVPKPGGLGTGGLGTHCCYFRPITLVNCLSKVVEKMVNRRLQALLESRTFYSPVQSGFRAGHSTLDCLSRLEYDDRMALLRKHYCVAVFLDIERAFDTVWDHGFLQKLSSLGISGNMANFLQGFLTRRTTQVKIGSHLSTSHDLVCGVPQGSVLHEPRTFYNLRQ